MNENKEELRFNLRYAQRLYQRTARFYRRIQTTLTFFNLLAGSSAVAALAAQMLIPSAWLLGVFAVSVVSIWRYDQPTKSQPTMRTSTSMARY